MAETLFEELKRYVHFTAEDEDSLRALHGVLSPHFERISTDFYARILEHSEARKSLEGGESRVGQLKVTLVRWMHELLQGPWGEAYYERRCRIGRVHVRIALPQHYMFGAMNVVRREFEAVLASAPSLPIPHGQALSALEKILDLELAIMLHTYREDLLAQQARSERLSTFGQLVGSIGHELRNPLGVIETSLFILKGRPLAGEERTAKHLQRIGEQVGLANRIISNLLDMIRDRPLTRERVSLPAVWDEAVRAVARPAGVALRVSGMDDGELPGVDGDPGQLRQVFVNLLENAVQAVGEAGEVRVSAHVDAGEVCLALEDSGPGLAPEVKARLFEPLITTRARGIGLGLPLVRRILERHGGSITYAPRPGTGARFILRLPVAA